MILNESSGSCAALSLVRELAQMNKHSFVAMYITKGRWVVINAKESQNHPKKQNQLSDLPYLQISNTSYVYSTAVLPMQNNGCINY